MSAEKKERVNGSEIDRGVWLVKVPKYLSRVWENAGQDATLGKLSIFESESGKSKIELEVPDDLTKVDASTASPTVSVPVAGLKPSALGRKMENSAIPKKHLLVMSEHPAQYLAVLSELKPTAEKKFKGNVVSRAEVRPISSQQYMDLKKQTFLKASIPTKFTKQLERAVVNFKPVNATVATIENEARKKSEPTKMRDEKDRVQEMLFEAFEKHQYYNIKDLERITRQPLSYLKEILKEVCIYNIKAPHRNMWELKPQFRHYTKGKDEPEDGETVKKEKVEDMDSDDDAD